jgi:hypothetical protein
VPVITKVFYFDFHRWQIGKIKEKNKRINKILNDLDLNEEVPLPTLSYYEEPEQLLTVKDEEVIMGLKFNMHL